MRTAEPRRVKGVKLVNLRELKLGELGDGRGHRMVRDILFIPTLRRNPPPGLQM